ncbi:TniQ family protein, partial [Dyella ginsengisoli]|uniref:TniQ family protein n=1 Tax=Dyella ginsengisoli TaxID=363848 RepID=UPI0019D71420
TRRLCQAVKVTPDSKPSRYSKRGDVVTIQTFLTLTASWWRSIGQTESLPVNPLYQRGGGIFCGVGPGVHRFVQALKIATGSSLLERTTFVSLTPAMSRQSIGLSRKSRAWCPACFQEHEANGSVYYDRLLWAMGAIKRCPIHKVGLISYCPSCARLQEFYHRDGGLGVCWSCGHELLTNPDSWQFNPNPTFGERDCVDLVDAISLGSLTAAYPDAFQTFFAEVLRAAPPKKRLRFGKELFNLKIDNSRALRTQSPHFSTMLRSTHATGVRLIDVLTSPVEAACVAGGMLVDRVDGRSERRPHKSISVIEECGLRLSSELAKPDEDDVLPLRELSRELGVGVGFLRYRFAPLIHDYERRRSFEKERQKSKRMRRMLNSLQKDLLKSFPSACYPTQERLAYAVMEKCNVGRRAAREAVKLALADRHASDMPSRWRDHSRSHTTRV